MIVRDMLESNISLYGKLTKRAIRLLDLIDLYHCPQPSNMVMSEQQIVFTWNDDSPVSKAVVSPYSVQVDQRGQRGDYTWDALLVANDYIKTAPAREDQ